MKSIDLTHIWSSNLVHDWADSLAKTEELKQFPHLNYTTAKTNCLSIELIYTNRKKCREMREREKGGLELDLNDGSGAERESGIGEPVDENELFGEVGLNPSVEAVEAHFVRHV